MKYSLIYILILDFFALFYYKISMKENNNKRVNCFDCIHLQITWQPQTPYACKAIGFRSKIIPSLEVFKNSGTQCMHFFPKSKPSK